MAPNNNTTIYNSTATLIIRKRDINGIKYFFVINFCSKFPLATDIDIFSID